MNTAPSQQHAATTQQHAATTKAIAAVDQAHLIQAHRGENWERRGLLRRLTRNSPSR